jgi:phospholipid/cholesterol/gamma-HCH transport system permease protein
LRLSGGKISILSYSSLVALVFKQRREHPVATAAKGMVIRADIRQRCGTNRSMKGVEESKATAAVEQSDEAVLLKVGGTWRLTEPFPDVKEFMSADIKNRKVRVVPEQLDEWDSSLPLFLLRVRQWCRKQRIELDIHALPEALKRLFHLILTSEEHEPAIKPRKPEPHPVARRARHIVSQWKRSTEFIGECAIGTMEVPTEPRHFHWKTFFAEMVEVGPKALPIIGMMSFLIGITFAFETSIQLERFGLQYYVVQGVGGSVLRQIGPLIAAVLLAGRTGAAFAAHIANMKLGGEIDALEMLGVSPVNFLILPRLAALVLMLPIITLYSDLIGILGGMTVCTAKIHMPAVVFWTMLQQTTSLGDVGVGLIKSFVFALLIGLSGTLRGLQSERSSVGVGHAVTSAVVTGIASIIAADALCAPIFHRLGM